MAHRLILDSGVIVALAHREDAARAYVTLAIRDHTLIVIPAVVIAETTRGTQVDAPINRMLNRIVQTVGEIAPVDERVARTAGRLLRGLGDAHPGHAPPTIDALIVAVAIVRGGGVLLTGDPNDLTALAANHPQVQIRDYRAS